MTPRIPLSVSAAYSSASSREAASEPDDRAVPAGGVAMVFGYQGAENSYVLTIR